MVNRKFEKYFRHVAYSYDEILSQVHMLQERYEVVTYKSQKDSFVVYIRLRPTNESITYTVKVCCRVGASKVNIYVVNPQIGRREKGKLVPHMYKDSSLCLYYPKYEEWTIEDDWSETLIPWVSIWLFNYEIWKETGEWLGGGKHPQ